MEEKILEFWKKNKIFEKSLEKKSPKGEYVFYDGPVTSNAPPVFHTMEPFSFKDAIPRYKTMRGYHVRRKGGWDTHGLPVELQIEKKLGLKSKKGIEDFGIDKFNKLCKESVWEYIGIWKDFTQRIGYWADQENAYVTYENNYIESVWNVIKEVDQQKLLYKDYKVVPWCPRCGTALSSHELAQGYEDVRDLSITAKFKVKSEKFKDAYFLAWTTTPWTLPGNVALAVGKDIKYSYVQVEDEIYVVASDLAKKILGGANVVKEVKGKEMIGMQYEPLYPYLKNQKPQNIENAYKVYTADFVSTEEGTGIVHTAVMYGQDDFELGTQVSLPKFHLVNPEGNFIAGTDWLSGRSVVDETLAVDILKDLQKRNLVFAKENYTHSYPFCWRCKTRLIYYARDSWYIRMSEPKIKKKLINENKKINWEPEHIREGRFGEWLRDVKDWAISRERYWGTPLPVWVSGDGERIVVDSLATLKKYSKRSGNKYFLLRHGEAENNIGKIFTLHGHENAKLTQKGKEEVKRGISKMKDKIDIIISSPYERARETAEIVSQELKYPFEKVIFNHNIQEWQVSSKFEGKDRKIMDEYYEENYIKSPFENFGDGESFSDLVKRAGGFIYELEKKYQNKNILISGHDGMGRALEFVVQGLTFENLSSFGPLKTIGHAEIRKLLFVSLPHNENYELDFHRPYIDEVVLEKGGKEFRRVKEVMDVWLDSGAMPFAQDHYPFSKKKILYPADYISEAIDQTRGWFYTLHAVGILMGRGRAYENVICLGHLLDAQGKKMSKSLGNVVDPWEMIEKYGADTLRLWMYSINQPGESKNFDEKTVQLLKQQVFGLLYNVLAFYDLYRDKNLEKNEYPKSKDVLDVWILTRLDELINLVTKNLDNYKLLEPTRAIKDFINDLSTWYLRRSRERIKEGSTEAKQTLYFVLKTLAKVMASFAPFAAEDIWLKLRSEEDSESVHLEEWPHFAKASRGTAQVLESMKQVREIVTMGLEARQKAGIPVRQPLSQLKVKSLKLSSEYLDLIKDELNVKEVVAGNEFKLSTEITPELKMEGEYREFMRGLQDRRKKLGLKPGDKMPLTILEIYKKYKIYPRLQDHMLRVAAVASLICDNFSLPIEKNNIVLAALLHDMGNIIKAFEMGMNTFSDYTEEQLHYWEEIKNEFMKKYGTSAHEATREIMEELGIAEKVFDLVDQNQFELMCQHAKGSDWEIKILHYSDGRVDPHAVVSYDERMEEARTRYKEQNIGREAEREKLVTCGAEIEKQIFAHCKIKPEDITDESVTSIIEELKKFVIE